MTTTTGTWTPYQIAVAESAAGRALDRLLRERDGLKARLARAKSAEAAAGQRGDEDARDRLMTEITQYLEPELDNLRETDIPDAQSTALRQAIRLLPDATDEEVEALLEVEDVEGLGAEEVDSAVEAADLAAERLAWLRECRADGTR